MDLKQTDYYSVLKDYIEFNYPIRKYKEPRRFVKAIKIDDNLYKLHGESQKNVYYKICSDIQEIFGLFEDEADIIILTHVKLL